VPPGRLGHAAELAAEGRAGELSGLVDALRAGHRIGPDDDLLLGTLVAVAGLNTEDFPAAARALDAAAPLLAAAGPVRQARYQVVAAWTAHGLGDAEVAIDKIVRALALVDGLSATSEDLEVALGNCGILLARLQLFPLAVDTSQRAIEVATRRGSSARARVQASYAHLAWGIQLEHLGMDDQCRLRWVEAIEHLDIALGSKELATLFRARGAAWRAICSARLGRVEDAQSDLDLARTLPVRPPNPALARSLGHAQAAVLLAAGQLAPARAQLLEVWGPTVAADLPLWIEDVAWLLGRTATAAGDDAEALRWHREMHQRYGRAQFGAWRSRAIAAQLRVDQEALLLRARELESDTLSDPLTGVPNRRAFDANLPRLVAAATATGTPLTLAIVDLDHFKRINDTYGHPVGDEVLRRVATILRQHSRDQDRCARFGGDELILCLPVAAPAAATALSRIARPASHRLHGACRASRR
jgi:GGDEF domain-containing protein